MHAEKLRLGPLVNAEARHLPSTSLQEAWDTRIHPIDANLRRVLRQAAQDAVLLRFALLSSSSISFTTCPDPELFASQRTELDLADTHAAAATSIDLSIGCSCWGVNQHSCLPELADVVLQYTIHEHAQTQPQSAHDKLRKAALFMKILIGHLSASRNRFAGIDKPVKRVSPKQANVLPAPLPKISNSGSGDVLHR